jgi:energy-converting hydrogenase Eha subunit C
MGMNWIPLVAGIVAIISGITIFMRRHRVSRSITNAQRGVFPFLSVILDRKKKPTGVAAASIFWVVFGALVVVISLVAIR